MYKRYIYQTLSVLTLISMLFLSFFFQIRNSPLPTEIIDRIPNAIASFFIYILIAFAINMLIGLGYLLSGQDQSTPFSTNSFLFGIITFKMKKIYYSDLGYFYITYNENYVKVYHQGYFVNYYLFSVSHNGDIDYLKSMIKSYLEDEYKTKLEKKRKKSMIKERDGYVDTPFKRDSKLEDILN